MLALPANILLKNIATINSQESVLPDSVHVQTMTIQPQTVLGIPGTYHGCHELVLSAPLGYNFLSCCFGLGDKYLLPLATLRVMIALPLFLPKALLLLIPRDVCPDQSAPDMEGCLPSRAHYLPACCIQRY